MRSRAFTGMAPGLTCACRRMVPVVVGVHPPGAAQRATVRSSCALCATV